MTEHDRAALDGASFIVLLAVVSDWLPAIAALLSVVWTVIRISETDRFRQLVQWWRDRRSRD